MLKYYFIVGLFLTQLKLLLKSEYEEASEYKPMNTLWIEWLNQTAARHNRWTGRTGAPRNPICHFIGGASLGQVLERLKAEISSPAHAAEKLEFLSGRREVSSPPRSWTLEGRTNLLLSWKHARGCSASPRWSTLTASLFQRNFWVLRSPGNHIPAGDYSGAPAGQTQWGLPGKHHNRLPWSCFSGEKQEIAPRIEHTHRLCPKTQRLKASGFHFS